MLNHNLYPSHNKAHIFALVETIFLFILFYSGFFTTELNAATQKPTAKSQGISLNNALSFDKNQPVDIQSDSAHFDEKTGNTIYEGNVSVTQAGHKLNAETLTIHRTKEGQIDHIEATGHPAHFLVQNHETSTEKQNVTATIKAEDIYENSQNAENILRGQANTIHYYPFEKKIVLLKNAELTQNEQFIRGGTLIYYLESKILISERDTDSKTILILSPKRSESSHSFTHTSHHTATHTPTHISTHPSTQTSNRDHYELFRSR